MGKKVTFLIFCEIPTDLYFFISGKTKQLEGLIHGLSNQQDPDSHCLNVTEKTDGHNPKSTLHSEDWEQRLPQSEVMQQAVSWILTQHGRIGAHAISPVLMAPDRSDTMLEAADSVTTVLSKLSLLKHSVGC